ncbi:MAG TPA: hypothetical protein VFT22_13695 [Kofleriaceae bacterium]|nr:hypothetical protein [Kofleriaceae bacterium]
MRMGLWVACAASLLLASACSFYGDTNLGGDPGAGSGTTPVDPPHAQAEHEIRGGRLHDAVIPGLTDAASSDPATLVAAVQADLRGRLGALRTSDFLEIHRNTTQARGGARLSFVTLRQIAGGVPIDDTYLYIGVRYSASGAKLVSSSYHLFENVSVDVHPAIPHDRAVVLAQQSLRLRTPVAPRGDALVIHQLDGHLQLAWSFTFPGTFLRAFVIASGSERGRVLTIDQRVFETTGTVSGPIVRGGAPGGAGTVDTSPLPNTLVGGGGGMTFAGATGTYAIEVAPGTLLTATLSGRAAVVVDQAGSPVTATGIAIGGGVTDLPFVASSEEGLAQLNAYYFVDQVRSFLEQNGMDPSLFGAQLPALTNENDTCNAFYDPGARNINFFHSGGGCNNSAIDTVIAHEYGHFVDDFNGGITNGGLSEGWGDLLACLWSKQSVVGFDLLPNAPIRNCQNDYVYPPGGVDEVHNLGQAWQGFGWDVRQNLIASLGPSGDDLARALLLPSFQSNAPDIPSAAREVFLRDDDDGDLSNHTPHWDALIAAANHHGLAFTVDPDTVPPAPVTDLAITGVEPTRIKVVWTATGDDGAEGTAASYQLRWSTSPIDAGNFAAAHLVPTGAPRSPGSLENAALVVPPESTIFIAVVVVDEQFNTSTLSNVATATTPAGNIAYQEGAEGDTSAWTATGLWHVTTTQASEGSHAFWYGQETTGNYDTGTTNSGDLTSPVIDLSSVGAPVLIYDQLVFVEPDPFDLTQLIVSDADDPTHSTTIGKDSSFTGGFVPRIVPLTGFDGKRIRLRFHFDTIDPFVNGFTGWMLDHLRIIGSNSCAHGLCEAGGPLDTACSPCTASVCAFDAFCCTVSWDDVCVQESEQTCGTVCTTCGNGVCEAGETPGNCPQDCTPPCAHDVCDPGAPLDQACDTCAGSVCGTDPFCCTVFWDRICVQESESLCGKNCEGCAHDFCNVGDPLASNCDACATSVCAADPFCCTTAWDSRCVQEAASGCGLACAVCSHSLCSQGTPLETGCDPCVTAICAADPYCCNNTWDERCVDATQTTCGLTCSNFR